MLPPVLEIYVVHHPEDCVGAGISREVFSHFHGTVFTGLIGGAIEVFVRSAPWRAGSDAPRPITFPGADGPNGVISAQIVAIVPVLSLPLARAVERAGPWAQFVHQLVQHQRENPERVGLFPISVDDAADDGTRLGEAFQQYQRIAAPSGLATQEPADELRCRDLAQGVAQMIAGPDSRLQVFISHTRHMGASEEDIPALICLVREIIGETRLQHFFDANDLQPGRDWDETLRHHAANSALLALRTDLYASRTWCQREMLIAKCAGMPIVILDSLGWGEERGSFLMDHVPRIPVREGDEGWSKADIRRGLNLLVDECLKRAVWKLQRNLAEGLDLKISWWAPHAPEPITLAHWLREQMGQADFRLDEAALRIIHPDPPLGPDEREALLDMMNLVRHGGSFEVMTPRGLAARGI